MSNSYRLHCANCLAEFVVPEPPDGVWQFDLACPECGAVTTFEGVPIEPPTWLAPYLQPSPNPLGEKPAPKTGNQPASAGGSPLPSPGRNTGQRKSSGRASFQRLDPNPAPKPAPRSTDSPRPGINWWPLVVILSCCAFPWVWQVLFYPAICWVLTR